MISNCNICNNQYKYYPFYVTTLQLHNYIYSLHPMILVLQVQGTNFSVCVVSSKIDEHERIEWNKAYPQEFIYHLNRVYDQPYATCRLFAREALRGTFYKIPNCNKCSKQYCKKHVIEMSQKLKILMFL